MVAVAAFAPAAEKRKGPRFAVVGPSEVARSLKARGRRPSLAVRFEPLGPTPGLEFMHGIMLVTASQKLRDAGAALIACGDLDTLRAVADEQRASDSVREVVVAYAGSEMAAAVDAGAAAALTTDAEAAEAARQAGLAVLGPDGDVVVSDVPAEGRASLRPTSREDAERAAATAVDDGFDGLLLDIPGLSAADLADALVATLDHLRSRKSKAFAGFMAHQGSTQLDVTDDQRKAIAWGKFVANAHNVGLAGSFDTPEPDEEEEVLDTGKGDYKGF